MDKLEHIFSLQAAFDQELARRRGLDYDFSTWVQKEALAIMVELGELVDEVNYKWWKNPRPVEARAVQEELVDILHFLISLCLKAGLSAEGLYQAYLEKNQENFRRQEGTSSKEGYV
ncbi:MAG: dUTPase [Clostridia bacterium]|nr:MAG: dUTPase [Clostridia bacterium]